MKENTQGRTKITLRKMVGINLNLSAITINVTRLNVTLERQRFSNRLKS